MDTNNIKSDTWQDILIKKGFDSPSVRDFVGFVSWNKGEEFPKLGHEITEVLSDYQGRIFAKDAVSRKHGDKALMFFSSDISGDTANEMFEAIMDYEQQNVYSPSVMENVER